MSIHELFSAPAASDVASLKEFYQDDFLIGAAIAPAWMVRPECADALRRHFSSITAENCMKPEVLLNHRATVESGSQTRAVFDIAPMRPVMDFARRNGQKVRFHVLVWHNQTPRWFFAENWSDNPEAPLASAEVMRERLKNAIADEMTTVNAEYPGLVYAWDVVNEAIEPDHNAKDMYRTKSCWYQTLGEEFVPLAFRCARKYQAQGQKLCYNDFNVAQPNKTPWVIKLVEKLHAEGLIDTVGFQTHIGLDYPDFADYEAAIRHFAAMGLTIQSTEMDIRVGGADPLTQMKLAIRYRDYFAMMRRLRREGLPIDSITLWGLADDTSWLMGWKGPSYPLLFDGLMRAKPAYFGAMLDARVPEVSEELNLPDTVEPQVGFDLLPDGKGTISRVAMAYFVQMNVDLNGKTRVIVPYSSVCDGTLTLHLDDVHAEPFAALSLQKADKGATLSFDLPAQSGRHDVIFVISAPAFRFGTILFQ